jgi:hypothetical protein
MSMKTYTEFPKTMFRLNPGKAIKLRPYVKGKSSYDVVVYDGDVVKPIADLNKYTGMSSPPPLLRFLARTLCFVVYFIKMST